MGFTYEELKNKMLNYRASNRLTQKDFAKEISLSEGTIVRLENENPGVKDITKIMVWTWINDKERENNGK